MSSSSAEQTQSFPEDRVHTGPFHPTVFELLYILNAEHHDDEISRVVKHNDQQRALLGCLLFLWEQCQLMSESVTWINCQMGMFAQSLTEDKDFTMNGPILVPHPPSDIKVLPLHVIVSKTDTTNEPFPTDNDISPNEPAFLLAARKHQRDIRRAQEVAQGQFLLDLRQQSTYFPETNASKCLDVSYTHSRGTGTASLPPNKQTLLYPVHSPIAEPNRTTLP
ncbi:hypothetical protein Moror_9477 [Moniliophthora roreri MCA 2997]|uniref:Uncharacterized protein n=1 Tax=Moniliophthora roreri (strain MCA 2997) TaxID=1381753 RepID=V2WZL3_MONRO|nr:hypothetical protein Moror_9477 [Moniliophthora roreri MCA 2997]